MWVLSTPELQHHPCKSCSQSDTSLVALAVWDVCMPCKRCITQVSKAWEQWHSRNKCWEKDLSRRLSKEAVKQLKSLLWCEARQPLWSNHCMAQVK